MDIVTGVAMVKTWALAVPIRQTQPRLPSRPIRETVVKSREGRINLFIVATWEEGQVKRSNDPQDHLGYWTGLHRGQGEVLPKNSSLMCSPSHHCLVIVSTLVCQASCQHCVKSTWESSSSSGWQLGLRLPLYLAQDSRGDFNSLVSIGYIFRASPSRPVSVSVAMVIWGHGGPSEIHCGENNGHEQYPGRHMFIFT